MKRKYSLLQRYSMPRWQSLVIIDNLIYRFLIFPVFDLIHHFDGHSRFVAFSIPNLIAQNIKIKASNFWNLHLNFRILALQSCLLESTFHLNSISVHLINLAILFVVAVEHPKSLEVHFYNFSLGFIEFQSCYHKLFTSL